MPYRFGAQIAAPTEPAHVTHASVDIAAPPLAVFRALVEPGELAAWLGDDAPEPSRGDAHADVDVGMDPSEAMADAPGVVPGSAWRVPALAPDGSAGSVAGEYLRIDAPWWLESTWRASWNRFATEHVRFELVPIDVGGVRGTRVTVTHTRAATQLHAMSSASHLHSPHTMDAWPARLARLAMYLDTAAALAAWGVPHHGAAAFGFDALHRAVVATHHGE
jgi:uncharacterized protein YndB with AHSA1/START domain